jgi:hypothetical protein
LCYIIYRITILVATGVVVEAVATTTVHQVDTMGNPVARTITTRVALVVTITLVTKVATNILAAGGSRLVVGAARVGVNKLITMQLAGDNRLAEH